MYYPPMTSARTRMNTPALSACHGEKAQWRLGRSACRDARVYAPRMRPSRPRRSRPDPCIFTHEPSSPPCACGVG